MIPERNPYNNWKGNGTTKTFDFDFLIEDETQLVVYHTNSSGVQTVLTYGTDYSINELGNENGSFITFPLDGSSYETLGNNEVISLCLTLPIAQENPFGKSSFLDLETLEYVFDYIIRICQIMNRELERSVKTPEGSDQSAEELIEALNEAQVNAANSAAAASASATSANNSAIAAGEEATIATQQVTLAQQAAQDAQNAVNEIEDLNLVDTDLSNITEAGENVIKEIAVEEISIDRENYLNKSMLSNCVLKVSKRAEYQINSPINVVLKAGAQLIKPNGRDINTAVHGSPAISNGVASNFTLSDYLGVPTFFNPGTNTWEMVIKWHTPATFLNDATIIGSATLYSLAINTTSSGTVRVYISSNGTNFNIADAVVGSNALSVNTNYYFRIKFTGTQYIVEASTDNSIWTNFNTINNTSAIKPCYLHIQNYAVGNTTAVAGGTIDLKESYLKIGDNYLWQGQTGDGTPIYAQFTTESDVAVQVTQNNAATYKNLMIPVCNDYDTTVLNSWYLGSESNAYSSYSGETIPTGINEVACWYDTAANKIRLTNDTGTTWQPYAGCFPVAIGQFTANTGITSIVKYFDLQAFLGATLITYPGATLLAPNGRNSDGTLKNIEFTSQFSTWQNPVNDSIPITAEILVNGATSGNSSSTTFIQDNEPAVSSAINVWYDTYNNLMKATTDTGASWVTSARIFSGVMTCSNGKIYDIDMYSPPNLTSGKGAYVVQTYRNGASWFRIWSDGWCEQGGVTQITSNPQTITLLKPYCNTDYTVTNTKQMNASGGGYIWSNRLISKSSNSFVMSQEVLNPCYLNWAAQGYTS